MKTNFIIFILFLTMLALTTSCKQLDEKQTQDLPTAQAPDTTDATNNFYDNVEVYPLPVTTLEVTGEIKNPGKADFSKLVKRSVIVKETLLDEGGKDKFIGAYRYDGYSLYDLLDNYILDKKNAKDFRPIIDLYIEVENQAGEKVIFSWGEIYYPNNLHKIIIATDVARIVPSKTKDLWVLPEQSKLAVANDLITERNISSPSKITVKSYSGSFPTEKGMSPMNAPAFTISVDGKEMTKMNSIPTDIQEVTFNTIFYGRGRGIHSTQPFSGVVLREFLARYSSMNKQLLQKAYVVMVGLDGYRTVASYSELFNRNDQQEFLLVSDPGNKDGGDFRIFPACDFFSDRAVKSLVGIYIETVGK